ncbi:HAMP domain-containing histidine kinase [Prolixibacteraceae bacterium JC049]|nr:HAMP domain-containing histidine kinase [Prolixibacteraceae bacterium JC049]
MSRKLITTLIVLMGLSIVGVITIQLIWISNAVRLNNELFHRTVNEALVSTVQQLENNRDLKMMDRFFMRPDSTLSNFFSSRAQKFKLNEFDEFFEQHATIDIDSLGKQVFNQQIVIAGSNNKNRISTEIHIKDGDMVVHVDSGRVVSSKLNRAMGNKVVELQVKSKQLMKELFDFEQGRDVNPELIEKVLTRELLGRGVNTPFAFGIVDNAKVSFLSEGVKETDLEKAKFWTRLFPNDFIPKSTRLAVVFPNQRSFVLGSINWILLTSLSLSCVILVIFTISIFMILKQKKVAQMKSDFVNNMTHEFKTPIATINVAANSITNEKVINEPKQITFFAQMIAKENKRMNQQVEKILRIARLDKKDFQLALEEVNAHEYISKVLEGFQLQIQQANGVLVTELNALQPVITTDITHFENVISNLIDNAVKYSQGAPKVSLKTENKDKGLLITVTDEGIGMTRSVQNKIFDRFYREASGNVHNVKGFGLGLSYVKAIVEANNGSISVSSEPNKGSSFKLFFPFTL